MNKMVRDAWFPTMGLALVLGACAEAASGEAIAPSQDEDVVEAQQILYNTNADGTWSANAWMSADSQVHFGADFTGPANKSRKMGVCGFRLWTSSTFPSGVTCSALTDCNAYPTTLPTGGEHACSAPDGAGTKYCFYRPGTRPVYCAGSPADGGAPVNVGPTGAISLSVGSAVPNGTSWISNACFEGCAVTDPSSSTLTGNCTLTAKGVYLCAF